MHDHSKRLHDYDSHVGKHGAFSSAQEIQDLAQNLQYIRSVVGYGAVLADRGALYLELYYNGDGVTDISQICLRGNRVTDTLG